MVGTVSPQIAFSQVNDSQVRKGIVFQDLENNSYKVKLGFRVQSLFTANFSDVSDLGNTELISTNSQVRRARIKFDGFVGNPNWVYKLELALGNRNLGGISEYTNMGSRLILDAVVKYQINGGKYSFWFGQTKLPGNRERVVSSQKLQFVDRSAANSKFNLDRDMGVQFHGKESFLNSNWKWALAISNGEGRNITVNNMGGFEYTARLEWLPLGNFTNKGDYVEADIYREETPKLSIGATFDFNDNASRTRSNQGSWAVDANEEMFTRDIRSYQIDLMVKYQGWSLLSEWFLRDINDPVAVSASTSEVFKFYAGSAFNAQVGYVFKNNWDISGRFTRVSPVQEVSSSDFDEYTLGVSRYVYGHNVKIQSDLTYKNALESNSKDGLMFRFQVEIGI